MMNYISRVPGVDEFCSLIRSAEPDHLFLSCLSTTDICVDLGAFLLPVGRNKQICIIQIVGTF
jgi:hypothetical protein